MLETATASAGPIFGFGELVESDTSLVAWDWQSSSFDDSNSMISK